MGTRLIMNEIVWCKPSKVCTYLSSLHRTLMGISFFCTRKWYTTTSLNSKNSPFLGLPRYYLPQCFNLFDCPRFSQIWHPQTTLIPEQLQRCRPKYCKLFLDIKYIIGLKDMKIRLFGQNVKTDLTWVSRTFEYKIDMPLNHEPHYWENAVL